MAELPLERRFRLLHSWNAKAERLFERADPNDKKVVMQRRKAADMAAAELDRARRREEPSLEELALALRENLDYLSASGTIRLDAPAPNTQDAPPQLAEVEAIRSEIARYNQVLSAQSAEELGGFLDLPIDEYPVALGLRRTPSQGVQRFASTPKRVMLAATISALLGVAGTWFYLQSARAVTVEIDEPQAGIVSLRLHNQTTDTLAFWIPLATLPSSAENVHDVCGIRVLGRGPDDDKPSLLPVEITHWQVPGRPGNPALPLTVGPGLSLSVDLDLQTMRRDYGPFDRMILQCVRRNGTIMGEAVYNLSPDT